MTNLKVPLQMQVQKTNDLSIFKVITGNRNLNTLHLNRLKGSMAEVYLHSPIIVNEKLEVIDGQHRIEVCKQLNLPVYYIICRGYGLEEIHRYNQNLKNWSMDDFMKGYIEMGKKEYELYKSFKDKYGFAHMECITMLCGNKNNETSGTHVKKFQSGNLRIPKYTQACIWADQIMKVAPYYNGWRRRRFISAILRLLNNPKFSINEFVEKLSYQQGKMYDCSNTDQYVDLIEEIYNYKRREKISLKYSQAA